MTFGCFLKSNPPSTNDNNHHRGCPKQQDKPWKSVSKKSVGNGSMTGTRAWLLLHCEHRPMQTFEESDSHKYKSTALLNAAIWDGCRIPRKSPANLNTEVHCWKGWWVVPFNKNVILHLWLLLYSNVCTVFHFSSPDRIY